MFTAENPEVKVSFSKFYALKPEEVLLRHQTPASLCLCEYHANVKLLIDAIQWLPKSTTDLVEVIVCDSDNEHCMLQTCKDCKDLQLFDKLKARPGSSNTREVEYEQWEKPDGERLKRRTHSGTVFSVLDLLRGKLKYFLFHVYVKRQQVKYWRKRKESPGSNTLLVMMDFSENFVHVTQDEIQKAFFDQTSSTIFTTMLYFEDNGQVSSEPYCILSDFKGYQGSKGHDKYAVSHYTRILVKDFQNRHPNFDLQKIEFLSDGTGQHFKQKYSLCQVLTLNFPHLTVIWNFSPTSHGKGPIDGIGGTLKRRVTEKVMGMRGKVESTAL